MATTPLSGSRRESVEPPSEVQVTVFRFPSDHRLDKWLARHRSAISLLAAATVMGALAAALVAGAGAGSGAAGAGVEDRGPAGIAAAYGYPPGCLRVRISALDPAFARADFARSDSCGLEGGFPSALFHRFGGEWHPVLYVVTYPCPMSSIPGPVQRELSVCPGRAIRAAP